MVSRFAEIMEALVDFIYGHPIVQAFVSLPTFLILKGILKEQKGSLVILAASIPGLVLPLATLVQDRASRTVMLIAFPATWIFPIVAASAAAYVLITLLRRAQGPDYWSVPTVLLSAALLGLYVFTQWQMYFV